ncbi:MAG TPA: hydrogenase maturation protease [Dictyobacter sp.]|jgi:hydrogenase maturation protease|nr:hydrogenase maturation protease [Dictyobacter sp.]
MMQTPVQVIGIGNEYRCDDSVGLVVVRTQEIQNIQGIQCHELQGDGIALLDCWTADSHVILIDAVSSGSKPGTIFRCDGKQTVTISESLFSSHLCGIAEALQLAQTLQHLPASLSIYGIVGENFEIGTELSPAVQSAVKSVTIEILHKIQTIRQTMLH